ncbi:MAG: DUF6273 domain-containing protein [Bifidobacteriaceae bacterium]|jgi:hypothetical protein|nr:DUF6273 domain-containing protein [Bifidobacteriaceae bacterium]
MIRRIVANTLVAAMTVGLLVACADERPSSEPSGGRQPDERQTDEPTHTDSSPSPQEPFSIENAQVGGVVSLGRVEFESYWGTTFSGDVGWRVLDISEGKALLITAGIVELRSNDSSDGTWARSEMREWLNASFFGGLTATAQSVVVDTEVATDDWQSASGETVDGGEATIDKVFPLSVEEADWYFSDDEDRRAQLDVSEEVILAVEENYYLERSGEPLDIVSKVNAADGYEWWLRSPGRHFLGSAAGVGSGGEVFDSGLYSGPYEKRGGVRPAMWVNLGGGRLGLTGDESEASSDGGYRTGGSTPGTTGITSLYDIAVPADWKLEEGGRFWESRDEAVRGQNRLDVLVKDPSSAYTLEEEVDYLEAWWSPPTISGISVDEFGNRFFTYWSALQWGMIKDVGGFAVTCESVAENQAIVEPICKSIHNARLK